jgi:serine/threonine protein phosphatase 1
MRTFAIGDIHGAHKALLQVFDRSGFDAEKDRLITLGDVTDYNPESAEVVEELLSLKNMIAVRGNHDVWAAKYILHKIPDRMWVWQGGQQTMNSYQETGLGDDPRHHDFFKNQPLYFVDEGNRLYVHAGFEPSLPIEEQDEAILCWSRKLWNNLMHQERYSQGIPDFGYDSVFIGHTPTLKDFGDTDPVNIGTVWNLDQGAKKDGRLTMMNVDTKEYWQSDLVSELYAD